MDAEKYEQIRIKYGKEASWAIWDTPFSLKDYQKVERRIRTDVVLVALNTSGDITEDFDFSDFHNDGHGRNLAGGTIANANKLIYAFKNTPYEGAYMTDIIKYETIKGKVQNPANAEEVVNFLEKHPEIRDENIRKFKEELEFIGSENPLIIAFGPKVYNILIIGKISNVCQVPPYFARCKYNKKEEYKKAVWKAIDSYLASGGNEAVKKEGNPVTYSPNVEKPEFSHNDTCTVHSDIEIKSANTKWARKPACLYPEEAKAFREVQKVLKDYGVDSRLREVRPFTNTDKPEKYIAIFLDDISDNKKQFCCIKIDPEKLNVISIEEAKVWKEDISSASEISSNEDIKRKLEGTLRNFGYNKKTS